MPYSPRNIRIACNHAGLTHYGGVYFFHEFLRVLRFRHFLATRLTYPRRNSRYHLSQMILALMYPIVLGLDRLETASFLRSNGTFQYLTGLPSFPDPQTLRRFLLQAPVSFWKQMHMVNDRLLQKFIHLPDHRSRLIFDLDSTVVTVFGHQEHAAVGYNPRYRGKRSYNPLLCIEANSSYLWDTELRAGNASTWGGSPELLDTCFANVATGCSGNSSARGFRFWLQPRTGSPGTTLRPVCNRCTYDIRTASVVTWLARLLYHSVNSDWEMADFELRSHGWPHARRFCVARRFIPNDETETTLFSLGRHVYRAWVTN